VRPGDLIEHFKGGKYVIVARSRSSDNPNDILITYLSMKDGQMWTRREVEFADNIIRDGYRGPRFKKIGETT
jgi:hypothetical protein